jgi:hypothetical protein
MAGSGRPGPLTPPIESSCIPPRTPGSLGINDQGDPNLATLLGDTPGSVGLLDWADPTLRQLSSTLPNANLVCVDPKGSALSFGFDLQTSTPSVPAAPAQYVSLDEAQETALKITTYFEGGKSMNYQALADDFDGQGTSFGLIQWNFGQNTLGPLLKKMLDKDGTAFKGCFGPDADYDTIKKAIAESRQADQLKWARDRIKNKGSAWESAFKNIGSNNVFNKIQREQAAGQYHPLAMTVIQQLRNVSPALFTNIELRSYAAIFDLCVQQGGIGNSLAEIKKRVTDEKPTSQLEVMKIVVAVRARKANKKWVSDCLSRRMGILTGAAYKSTENDTTMTRKNPQFGLLLDSGAKYVSGL